jgi:phosphoesterase RecJ-like protein
MREAADLLEFGFDHAEITRLLYDSHSFGEMQLRATVMQSLKSYEGGKITIAEITDEMIKNSGLREDQVPNVVDIPRGVAGTEIAVLLKPKDGEIRVNLRSNGDADVSEIALQYGGGGHKKAAGCGIKGATLEEAEKIILKSCAEVL